MHPPGEVVDDPEVLQTCVNTPYLIRPESLRAPRFDPRDDMNQYMSLKSQGGIGDVPW